MEITGKVVKINEPLTGQSARGQWKKQELIIETEEQYPRQVCLMNWNDKANFANLQPGTRVTAGINIESREFNGRWFTDVKIWKLDIANAGGGANQAPMPNDVPPPEIPDANDPFGGNGGEDDGLPF